MATGTPRTEAAKVELRRRFPNVADDGTGYEPGFVWNEYEDTRRALVRIEAEARDEGLREARQDAGGGGVRNEPRTVTGRRLVEQWGGDDGRANRGDILDIEAEAAAGPRDEGLIDALIATLKRDDLCDETNGEHHTDDYIASFLMALDTERRARAALAKADADR